MKNRIPHLHGTCEADFRAYYWSDAVLLLNLTLLCQTCLAESTGILVAHWGYHEAAEELLFAEADLGAHHRDYAA